jgi:hypothetical protein
LAKPYLAKAGCLPQLDEDIVKDYRLIAGMAYPHRNPAGGKSKDVDIAKLVAHATARTLNLRPDDQGIHTGHGFFEGIQHSELQIARNVLGADCLWQEKKQEP